MPRPSLRSRSLRRIKTRTISKTVLHYKKRKPSKHKCGNCGKILIGIPHKIKSRFKNLPKTKKRPSRPYGGVLCSSCMRKEILSKLN